jgi:hypothetical protein
MPSDHAYELLRDTLKAVLPTLESCARMAKSTPAKRSLNSQIGQIKKALKAADQAESSFRRVDDLAS